MTDEDGRYWRIPVTVSRTFYIDYWSDEATTRTEAAEQASHDGELYELFPSSSSSSRDDVDADWSVNTDNPEWWPTDPNPTYLCPVCRRDVKAFRVPTDDGWVKQIERHILMGVSLPAVPDDELRTPTYCEGGGQPAGEPR